jgi:hypothetical protein
MVRPTQEGRARALTDAESDTGTSTSVGDDGIDFDNGGSDPGGGGTVIAPAAEQLVVITDSGAAVEIDFSLANWWDITLTANCTLTIVNAPASGTVGRLHVILRQGGAGSYTVTWPAEVEWGQGDGTEGGVAPALHTAADARDEFELVTEDGGTSYGITFPRYELNIEGGQGPIKAHGNMGSTETFDPSDGNVHTGTLNANCTVTLNAPSGSGSCTLEFWITEDATGGRTITWPGSVVETGVHDTTLNTTSRVILETIDAGTNWVATWIGGSSGSSLTVKDEGTPLATAATSLDFVGPLVTASGATAAKTITITGALDDLTDVTLTTPASADRLRFDGSVWRNSALIWRPVMVLDPTSGNYLPVTASGDAVMTEA